MKLGILGGTFDPPHLGHLALAATGMEQLGLQRVLWVLTGQSPFKQTQALSPSHLRLSMVAAAIADYPAFALSRVDLDRPAPQYSADTVMLLSKQFPHDEMTYVMGTDSLLSFPEWDRPQEILGRCNLGVFRRPGFEVDPDIMEERLPGISERIYWINGEEQAISGWDVRCRVRAGLPIAELVPEKVADIILTHGLYTGKNSPKQAMITGFPAPSKR